MTLNPSRDDSSAYLAPPPVGAPDTWSAAGGTQQLLKVAEIDPPSRIAEALSTGEPVVVRRRLMLMNDRPVEIADSYYPVRIAAGTALAERQKIPGGAPALLSQLGLTTAYADEAIDLDAVPTAEEADLLQVAADQRVVRLFRVAYTAGGTPIDVATAVMLPTGRTLRHRIAVS